MKNDSDYRQKVAELVRGRVAKLQVDMEEAILLGNHKLAEALRIKRQEAQLILNTVLLVDL